MTYRIVLGISVIAAAVLTFFFLWGVADASLVWDPSGGAGFSLIFVVLAWGIIAMSIVVHRAGNSVLAAVILMPVLWPAIGYGLILLVLMTGGVSWR
ncbi:MAG: hypothetical protein ACT4N8_07385 [Sphingosinicella sp.]|uniref:hypothetical protein n=1 Tax=Sphingosinicella sp. TaxID=1917971 RepID=UPI00403805D2